MRGSESSGDPGGSPHGHGFGTFGGVFVPSILTIFGLIMFMRANYVVGNAGIARSFFILALASGITSLTGLSISAISTNTPVSGGGAYFLISRVLGPGFGTAIGLALFLAQAISVPFYILGFVEALTTSFSVPVSPLVLCLVTLALLFGLAWSGADWAIKVQYVVLAALVLAIVVFLTGAAQRFSPETFQQNLGSHFAENQTMWTMFAIYFPAVTGIMAGVNMSGDLKDPARAIPLGCLLAVLVGFLVYGAQIVICGGMASAADLRLNPFGLLLDNAWLGLRVVVIAGVFCATISSAIGSILGAPRVLQALARDRTLKVINPFAAGVGIANEPRRALVVTVVISAITLLLTARQKGGGGLNLVASVVTMVFLYTYGMTNLAAFVESFGANPSFRPRFRFFHWGTGLVGALACVWTAVQINPGTAVLALAFLGVLFLIAGRGDMVVSYGDARWGFTYQRLRNLLFSLEGMPVHPKNWRPTIMVLAGNPHARLSLITYARWLGMNCGIVTVASVLEGELAELAEEKREEQDRLSRFIADNELDVFAEVVVVRDFDRDLSVFLQAHSVGPIKPNVVLVGWARDDERLAPYFRHLRTVASLGKSIVIVIDRGMLLTKSKKRIDCWWRGQQNGALMVILAHLLMQNSEWARSDLRLLRQVDAADEVADARKELEQICVAARIEAEIAVPVSTRPFPEVLREQSEDATLVFLGLNSPGVECERDFHRTTEEMLVNMPTTLMVYSSGEAQLQA